MAKTVLFMWMSVDGFIAGPDDGEKHPLGVGGEVLHGELGEDDGRDRPSDEAGGTVFDELMATGAVLVGRRTFDVAGGYGGDHHDGVPIFVLTRTPRESSGLVHYVTDLEDAVAQARAAAGDREILTHGASAAQALVKAGLLDEMELTVAPFLLGAGRRLFEDLPPEQVALDKVRVLSGPDFVHVRYRFRK